MPKTDRTVKPKVILTYLWSWVHKINLAIAWPYSIAMLVMILELFLVVSLLPLNFNVSAFIIASSWHGLSFLVTEHIGGRLSLKRSRFIISLIIIAIVVKKGYCFMIYCRFLRIDFLLKKKMNEILLGMHL